MMRNIIAISTALLSTVLISDVTAFTPMTTIITNSPTTSTILHYNIVVPPDDDNCEVEGSDCEESFFARKRREKQEAQAHLNAKYEENGLKLSDIDRQETVDQYSNAAGGGIIPGMQLSALMEDD